MVAGTPLTLKIGLIAGVIGLGIGTVFGFVGGYYGGFHRQLLNGRRRTCLTVPGLLVLIVIAVSVRGGSTSRLRWRWSSRRWPGCDPTRTIRVAGADHARARLHPGGAAIGHERPADHPARDDAEPAALSRGQLVGAVATAILASIGLEALGLGPQNQPTLGMTIYWALYYATVMRGLVWWWLPPIVIIVLIFVGLFSITAGLDEIANPRLRTSGQHEHPTDRRSARRRSARCVLHTRRARCKRSTVSLQPATRASGSGWSGESGRANPRRRWRSCA